MQSWFKIFRRVEFTHEIKEGSSYLYVIDDNELKNFGCRKSLHSCLQVLAAEGEISIEKISENLCGIGKSKKL